MVSLTVPDNYGYVVLGCCVLPFVASTYMGGMVIKSRDSCGVEYPNLYATPGFHKKADDFNRCQRGHQSMFEFLTSFTASGLLGGLKHPKIAAAAGIIFSVGSIFYQIGYADTTLDVKMARYKKGGGIKYVGIMLALGTCVSAAGSMNGWW
jgi:glutathione S-transferase